MNEPTEIRNKAYELAKQICEGIEPRCRTAVGVWLASMEIRETVAAGRPDEARAIITDVGDVLNAAFDEGLQDLRRASGRN